MRSLPTLLISIASLMFVAWMTFSDQRANSLFASAPPGARAVLPANNALSRHGRLIPPRPSHP